MRGDNFLTRSHPAASVQDSQRHSLVWKIRRDDALDREVFARIPIIWIGEAADQFVTPPLSCLQRSEIFVMVFTFAI